MKERVIMIKRKKSVDSALPYCNNAFTLAEVLITLVIIGVIAAMTVPTLMNNTNNQEYVSKLKKAYSTLAQATNLIIAEEGTPRADKGGWATNSQNIYNLYKKYLLNAKDCATTRGCFNQGAYKHLKGGTESNWNEQTSNNKLILADGTQILFSSFTDDECASNNIYGSSSKNICGLIYIDINGEKKPNTIARDVFGFVIKENGLYPQGCDYDTACDPNVVESLTYSCACKILREGAMNY